jgi:transcriptional regulator with XRE-family HTH domain
MEASDQVEPSRIRAGRGRPNPVDVHVGGRLRQRRTLMGMSQEKLAEAIGLTFQQVQKYERGANRIGASRLHQLARVLEVPVSYFFEEMAHAGAPAGAEQPGFAEEPPAFEHDPMSRRETLELVRAYYRIPDGKVRKRVFEMVKAIAASGQGEVE